MHKFITLTIRKCQIIASSPRNLFCFHKTELLAVSRTFSELLQLCTSLDTFSSSNTIPLPPQQNPTCPLVYLKFYLPYKKLSRALFLSFGPHSRFCVFDTTYLLFFTITPDHSQKAEMQLLFFTINQTIDIIQLHQYVSTNILFLSEDPI